MSRPNEVFVEPDDELLVAAQRGDWERLERLLSKEDDTATRDVVVRIEEPVAVTTVAPRDSVLHVVASRGDGEEFLKSATVIYNKASRLLQARNSDGDTPLHCAARAGWGKMLTHLVALATRGESDDGGHEKVKAMLRMQNEKGETVLHEAVRLGNKDMVGWLMSEDPQLARIRPDHGASPLYLAVSLEHDDITRQLYDKDQDLPYSGPDGQNALHVAVQKGSSGMTKTLLEWNKGLTKQCDRSSGSTPLHFGASWGKHEAMSLLLAADHSAAYQGDSNGSFAIHVAASMNEVKAVSVLLDVHNGRLAELRDADGRTFLHVAVAAESRSVVTYARKVQSMKFASSVMNMQDKDGNSALHLAVKTGNLWIFNSLLKNLKVKLNLTNNRGQTPLDVSQTSIPSVPRSLHIFLQNPRTRIQNLLQDVGAQSSTYRLDRFCRQHIPMMDEVREDKAITSSSQVIGIGSVLIATVTFAAAFALPGGYRGADDDHDKGGTPTLAGHYAFDVLVIAITLAFVCAAVSIICLICAGLGTLDVRTRIVSSAVSVIFLGSSARSVGTAFGFGLYVVLAPVARATAVASCAITFLVLALVDAVWFIRVVTQTTDGDLMLLQRVGIRAAWWRLARGVLVTALSHSWQYIVIAVVVMFAKINRVH